MPDGEYYIFGIGAQKGLLPSGFQDKKRSIVFRIFKERAYRMIKNLLRSATVAAAMAAVLALLGCGDPARIVVEEGGRGTGLVGDWRYESASGARPVVRFSTFAASWEETFSEFIKVGDFWIERTTEYKWRAEDGKWYFIADGDPAGADWELWGAYTLSGNGNTLTITTVVWEQEVILTRADLATFKNSLGTIYRQDGALHGLWQLSGGEKNLWMDLFSWYYEPHYFDGSRHYDYTWYTSGDRLFLLGLGCDEYKTDVDRWGEYEYCAVFNVSETVELLYSVGGVGDDKTLTLQRVGPDGSLGSPDVWSPVVYSTGVAVSYVQKKTGRISQRPK